MLRQSQTESPHDTNNTPASLAPCQGEGGNLFTVQHHITRAEAAKILGMSEKSVDRRLESGALTKVKHSDSKQGAVRIPYRSVLNYLRGIKKTGAPVTTQGHPLTN